MPAPTSPYSTDHYLYKYVYTPLAKNICFIHPNYISLANILISIPLVVYALLNRWSLGAIVAVFLFHIFIDCMDGAVARACDKKSKLGAALDVAGDLLFILAIILTVLYIIIRKYGFTYWKTIFITALFVIQIIAFQTLAVYIDKDNSEANFFYNVILDNSIIIFTVSAVVVWWIVNRL